MSGLILISLESDLALDKSSDTSMVRVSLTSIGCGFVDWSRYFPSLSRSRIDRGLMEFSPSVTMDVSRE